MRVLANLQVRQNPKVLPGGRQFIERGKRDENFVADPADIDGDLRGQHVHELPFQKRNHAQVIQHARATDKNESRGAQNEVSIWRRFSILRE